MEGNCRLSHFGTAFSRAQDQAAQTPRGEGLFAETSEPEHSAVAPEGQSRWCYPRCRPVTKAAPCRVLNSLSCQRSQQRQPVQCLVVRGLQTGQSSHQESQQKKCGRLQPSYAGREGNRAEIQDRTVPRTSRKEQLRAAFTRHQPLELQLLQAPAEQLAPIIHLVTGASGYPAEQERPAKNTRSTSPPASAPFLA